MAPTRVILMSCGSYNPPTNMHLRMFEIARDHLHRMGTHIVVGGVISPVHDAYAKKELANATHRCAMLRLALQHSDWIRLSTWETRQNCWTKTRLSLQHHQNLLNSMLSNSNDIKHHLQMEDIEWIPENVKNSLDNSPIQIKLLCGADLLESFGICGLWLEEDIHAIVGEHGLVVITREGFNPNKFIYDSDILSKYMYNICIVTEWIPNEVSSTRIRRALKRSESVKYLLQDAVIDYIYKHEIYDAKTPDTTIKLELPSPNANNYLHIDPRYLTAFLTPSPSDVTMDSPSPVEIATSIDVPDAVVLCKNLQNTSSGGGLDEIREHFINSAIGSNADNGNVKLVARAAYPGQAKQVIASETGVALIIDEVGPLDESIAKVQPGPSSEKGHRSTVDDVAKSKTEIEQIEISDFSSKIEITDVDLGPKEAREIAVKFKSGSLNSSELLLKENRRLSLENIAKSKEASDLNSKEVVNIDIGLSEITMKIQSSQSNSNEFASKENCRSIIESVVKEKIEVEQREILDLRSKREIVDANLSSNNDREIIVKVQPGPSNSNELVSKSAHKSITENTAKDKTGIRQKDVSGLRSKTEIADIHLGTNDDREIIMKIQPSQSSSSELRLGECCWPTRESTANDKLEVYDREISFEKEIIDIKLGLDEKSTLMPKERRKSMIGATSDETSSIKIEPEMSSRFSQKREIAISKEVNIKKEIIEMSDFTNDVVKVQPAHLSHSILTLKEDRRLMIEKLMNVEIKCNEGKIRSKENLELDKVDKNDTELIKVNIEIDNSGISSLKETANIELNKVEYLEAKTTTSSLNRSMTSLDGRHECALSDFGIDKEDYRLSQYGSDEDEGEKKKPMLTTRLSLTKYTDDHREDVIDNLADFVNDNNISIKKSDIQSYNGQLLTSAMFHKSHEDKHECFTTEEISKRAKSSEEVDQSKFIVEKELLEAEINSKTNIENGKRTEEIIRMSPETDKASRTEKGSEVNTHYSEWQTTSGDPNLEIDGKYLKSIVNLRKSPRKIREDQIHDVEIKEHQIVDDQQTFLQSDVFQNSCTKTKSSEKINEEKTDMKTYKIDVDIEKKDRIINNEETFSAEKVFQDSSRLISMKMKSPTKVEEFEINEGEHEFKNRDISINGREMFHLEKVFQNSSRSISTKIKNARKVEELQISENKQEFRDQDRSISDQETSRSVKASQKSSRTSISAKSPKKVKKSQIPYKSEMKEYDRSINDRVISQLEEVFQDSLKKSLAKTESPTKDPENYIELKKQNRFTDNRETSRSEELSQHSSRTSSTKSPKKTQSQKAVKMNDNKGQRGKETTKTTNNTDNRIKHDLNEIKDVYTRKVRRYNVPLQGSLDSVIVSNELSTEKPKKDDAFSKKSKSYESIKRIQEVFLGVPSTKTNNSSSQLDIPDEFCSICCYMNDITFRTEEEVSSPNQETFYTLRSTCSSLADDDDSIECDICSSLNLQESTDDLEGKVQDTSCEFCRICDEVDGNFDQDSTLSTSRYAFKVIEPHREDDDSFEIENCGFQSGTESADDRSRIFEKEKIKDPGRPKSQSLFIHGSSMTRDQPRELYFIPKDEIAILTSGTRKVGRKGSLFRKKEDFNGSTQDNRRYSSVDSLQLAKMSSKANDKILKVTKNQTLLGSADNLQISKDSKKSISLQRSADNVGCLNLSINNLNSLSESFGKENETEESVQKPNIRDKEAVKMILTQHGIKIISEKETAL